MGLIQIPPSKIAVLFTAKIVFPRHSRNYGKYGFSFTQKAPKQNPNPVPQRASERSLHLFPIFYLKQPPAGWAGGDCNSRENTYFRAIPGIPLSGWRPAPVPTPPSKIDRGGVSAGTTCAGPGKVSAARLCHYIEFIQIRPSKIAVPLIRMW